MKTEKIEITLFDAIRVDLRFESTESGYKFRGVFPVFLEYNREPQLTWFAEPNGTYHTPHLTIRGRGGRKSRYPLARIHPARLVQFGEDVRRGSYERFLKAIEPVDLDTAWNAGWSFHYASSRAVERWISRATSSALRVDSNSMSAFAFHVLRCVLHPRALDGVQATVRLLALHCGDEDIDGVRPLLHFEQGLWLEGEQIHSPGWYWHPYEIGLNDVVTQAIPQAAMSEALTEIQRRFDECGRRTETGLAGGDRHPIWVSQVFGFHALDLLNIAFKVALDRWLPPPDREPASLDSQP